MGTKYNHLWCSTLDEAELEGEAERRYIEACDAKNASIMRHAEMVYDIEGGMYWTDADEAVLRCAERARERKARVEDALFSMTGELCSVVDAPQLLTDELVERRREAMLEACRLYREAAPKFSGGGLDVELLRRVDEYEAKANALKKHEGHFDASRYYR